MDSVQDPRQGDAVGNGEGPAALRVENAELRRLVTRLATSAQWPGGDATWLLALEGSRDGVWDWSAVTGQVYFSPRWKEMLGYEDGDIAGSVAEWETRVHPDDRERVFADLGRHFRGEVSFYENEHRVRCKDGSYKWILDRGRIVAWADDGSPERVVGTHTDVTARREAELERERLLAELQAANKRIHALSGLLPICSACKKIRDDAGQWIQLETYIREHSAADFSHGMCPCCVERFYPGTVHSGGG